MRRSNPLIQLEIASLALPGFLAMTGSHRQNKSPFAIALGDWFPLRTYFLTSKASPNDAGIIVIIVVIIVSEAKSVWHSDGIIAQSFYLDRVSENWECLTLET